MPRRGAARIRRERAATGAVRKPLAPRRTPPAYAADASLGPVRRLEPALVGPEEIASCDNASYLARRTWIHDDEAADPFANHVVGRLAKGIVLVGDPGRTLQDIAQTAILQLVGIEQVAAGDDANQAIIAVHHRKAIV